MGTWVEITITAANGTTTTVVPRMGTWVEIFSPAATCSKSSCRPPHGDVG